MITYCLASDAALRKAINIAYGDHHPLYVLNRTYHIVDIACESINNVNVVYENPLRRFS
jgi:hypothetical protein